VEEEEEEEREGFDRVFQFVESHSITASRAPWLLFDYLDVRVHACTLAECETHGRPCRGPSVSLCGECVLRGDATQTAIPRGLPR